MSGNLIKKQTLPILTFILFLFIWQCVIWIGDYKPI
ncbi:ABC transporter permease, partial [Mesorhizobium sp. M8A.F.Ca.ET.173.01.1.1]